MLGENDLRYPGRENTQDPAPSTHNRSEEDDRLPVNKDAPPPPPPPRDFLASPILFMMMSFVSFVFTVVSVGLPWYRVRQYKPASTGGNSYERLFYLFKGTLKEEGSAERTLTVKDLCYPVRVRVKVMEAFAIVSAVMALVTLVLSVVNGIQKNPSHRVLVALLCFTGFTMGALTILVSFNFNVYLWSFAECGAGTSYHSQLYEPYIGFGLTVTAWVLTGFGGLIAANNLFFCLDARAVDSSIRAFACLALVAMLFATVACPIPHWFYKDGDTRRVTDVLLWRHREGNFNWDVLLPSNRSSTFVADLGCSSLIRYYRAAESFSILSIFFNTCAGATGLLLWKSLMGTRLPALLFSYMGVITTLAQMALELKIYYGNWCFGKYAYHKQYYVLTAGFALVAASFCIMCVASVFITLVYVLTNKYFPAKKPSKSIKEIVVEGMA